MPPETKLKSNAPDSAKQKPATSPDVQPGLVSRYREALKSGDKNFAKSTLLSPKSPSLKDPTIANDIYVLAKSEGDVAVAAKCFTNVFQNLLLSDNGTDSASNEALVVADQMKEESRLLLGELKSQYLRLKSTPNTAGGVSRQNSSVSPSPLLSPRLRMSSEDRSMSRDSALKLNTHLNGGSKSLFYHQLYEDFSQDVKRDLLINAIDNADNPFERCRLMMLAITLSNANASTLSPRLIQTLIELSESKPEKISSGDKAVVIRPPNMRLYAKSMLVLDAVPLVFGYEKSLIPEIDLDQLFQRILDYYAENCLENIAREHDFDELHDGLKKSIAARILGKEIDSSLDESTEDNIILALDCLFQVFLQTYSSDKTAFELLKQLRSMTSDRSDKKISFAQIKDLITKLDLEHDIPEDILFLKIKDYSTSGSQTPATPPPKARGRPKKSQASVIVSPDDGVRRHLQSKSKEALFVFYSLVQYMFYRCSQYLRQTRSRIMINFRNTIADDIADTEMAKNQRSSRTKLQNTDTYTVAAKRLKTESQNANSKGVDFDINLRNNQYFEESPLNSEQSRKVDLEILNHLQCVQDCIKYLSTESPTLSRLWTRLLEADGVKDLKWFSRIYAECLILGQDYEPAIAILDAIAHKNQEEVKVKKEPTDSELSTLTISTSSMPSVEVVHLRALAQLISCYTQTRNNQKTYECIGELMSKTRQSGLLTNDENYLSGNIIDEYRMLFEKEESRGFLFFDALSLIRYVNECLMSILSHYVANPSLANDTIIGHTIVLTQIDWPKESSVYGRCIAWSRANKPTSTTPQSLSALTKFTYTDFFQYIFDPNILEDFVALLNKGYTLDIKSSQVGSSASCDMLTQVNSGISISRSTGSGTTRAGKAITTRGVNKTFKEDLKVALIAQMKNSTNLIPLDLMSEFIQLVLIPYLRENSK